MLDFYTPTLDEEENPEEHGFSVMNFGQTIPLDEDEDDKKKDKDEDEDDLVLKEEGLDPLFVATAPAVDPHDEIIAEPGWDQRELLDTLEREQRLNEPPLGSDLGDEEE